MTAPADPSGITQADPYAQRYARLLLRRRRLAAELEGETHPDRLAALGTRLATLDGALDRLLHHDRDRDSVDEIPSLQVHLRTSHGGVVSRRRCWPAT